MNINRTEDLADLLVYCIFSHTITKHHYSNCLPSGYNLKKPATSTNYQTTYKYKNQQCLPKPKTGSRASLLLAQRGVLTQFATVPRALSSRCVFLLHSSPPRLRQNETASTTETTLMSLPRFARQQILRLCKLGDCGGEGREMVAASFEKRRSDV